MTDRIRATVAVTGMNATDNPAPGVAVVRALRDAPDFGGRVVGLGYDPLDPGFYTTGLIDAGAILPYPSVGRDAFLARIRDLAATFHIDAMLPTLDSELRATSALEPDLRALGIGTFVPSLEAIEHVSKSHLAALEPAADIHVPEAEATTTPDAIARLAKRFGLPLVVKGVYYGAYVAHSEADAVAAFHQFEATWGLPVVVQTFVGGDEYNVCALGDGAGNTIGAVAMRKLALTDKGKGWAGVTVLNPRLIGIVERIIGSLRWRGPLEVELIVTGGGDADEDYHVIEINPRFPAWVYLTAAAGQNLPYLCARLALGLPVTRPSAYASGRMFVRISIDQIADLATFGALSATGILPVIGAQP